jgi:hypothetical protein
MESTSILSDAASENCRNRNLVVVVAVAAVVACGLTADRKRRETRDICCSGLNEVVKQFESPGGISIPAPHAASE